MRTYTAGTYTSNGESTHLGSSDDIVTNTMTVCVQHDSEVSILRSRLMLLLPGKYDKKLVYKLILRTGKHFKYLILWHL
jgi:hypothetical protein